MLKTYSIVVTYNPEINELKNSIERLNTQTDLVIICNNSDYELTLNEYDIKIFNFNRNLGIAKAQSIGMKWAFENGADFVLQMDQDSIPNKDLVQNLLACYQELVSKGYQIGLVGAQDYDKDTLELSTATIDKGHYIESQHYIKVSQVISSGSLIPKATYELIGGMDDGLFIDAVDFEYCWRALDNNLLIVKNNKAKIAHKLGNGTKRFLGVMDIIIPSPIRHYYQTRNYLLLLSRSYVPMYWKISGLVKIIITIICLPFLFDERIERTKYFLKGIKDGFLRKEGNIDHAH